MKRTLQIVGASAVALVVFLALFPASGVDTLPPICWSFFGNRTSCGGLAAPTAAAIAVAAGLAVWWLLTLPPRLATRRKAAVGSHSAR